jgi:hypothetical protein
VEEMSRTILVFLVLLLAACGSQTANVPDQPAVPTGTADPYGDPPDYAGDPFAGFDRIVSIDVPGDTVEPEEIPEETVEVPEVTSNLPFSVQISAAAEEATAVRLAEQVGSEVDAPVYIDHVGQYWKVRVGGFATREETEGLLHQLREMGFTDAWVVERVP